MVNQSLNPALARKELSTFDEEFTEKQNQKRINYLLFLILYILK